MITNEIHESDRLSAASAVNSLLRQQGSTWRVWPRPANAGSGFYLFVLGADPTTGTGHPSIAAAVRHIPNPS